MTPESRDPSRPQNLLHYEERFWGRDRLVAGVDEAGRGPLAAAVVLPPGVSVEGADDSKKLSAAVREGLFDAILSRAHRVGIGAASVREIDRLNILRATTLAMRRALAGVEPGACHVVVDGRPVKGLEREHEAVVGGDHLIHSVGCASIVAKVVRDRLMRRLAARYPGYGWETNVGYGTAQHRAAIQELGYTPHHRRSFNVQTELKL